MPFLRDLVDLVRILRIFSQNLARFCSNLLVTLIRKDISPPVEEDVEEVVLVDLADLAATVSSRVPLSDLLQQPPSFFFFGPAAA